jgi:hypothetical protein
LDKKRLFFGGLILAFAFFMVLCSGCGKEPEKKPPQQAGEQQGSQKPKEPKELKDITKDIESILKEAEKKQKMQEKPQAEQQGQQQNKQDKQEQGQQSQTGQGGEEGKQQSSQQGQQQGGQQETQKMMQDWSKEEKAVEGIHQKWNSLETAVVKAGAEEALIAEFETNLDNLTDQVMSKSLRGTQKAANELYGSSVKIADHFQTNNPPPADMLKYYTQNSLLAIEEGNWTDAAANTQDLRKQWEKVKTMLDKDSAQLITQMDYAISDFDQSIMKQNKEVAKIKGKIVLTNTEKIIKKMQENKKK